MCGISSKTCRWTLMYLLPLLMIAVRYSNSQDPPSLAGSIKNRLGLPHRVEDKVEIHCVAGGFNNLTRLVLKYNNSQVGCEFVDRHWIGIPANWSSTYVVNDGNSIEVPDDAYCAHSMRHTGITVLTFTVKITTTSDSGPFKCEGRDAVLGRAVQGTFNDGDIIDNVHDKLPPPPTRLAMTFDIGTIQEKSEFRIYCHSSKSTAAYQYQILKKNQPPLDINGRGDLYTNTGIYTTGRGDREGFTIRCYDKLYGLKRGNNQTMVVWEIFPEYIEAVGEMNLELTLSHSETRQLTCSDHVTGRPDPSIFEWKINGTTVHTSDTFSLAADRDADIAKVQRAVLTCTASVDTTRTLTIEWNVTWSTKLETPLLSGLITNALGLPHRVEDKVEIHCVAGGFNNLTRLVLKYNNSQVGCEFIYGRWVSTPSGESQVVHDGFTLQVPTDEYCRVQMHHSVNVTLTVVMEITEKKFSDPFKCEGYDSVLKTAEQGTFSDGDRIDGVQDELPPPPTGLAMTFDIGTIQENSEFRIYCRSSKSTAAYQFQILKKNQPPLDINGRGDLYTNTGIYTTGRGDREGFTIRCYDKLYGLKRGNNQTMIVREIFPAYIEAVGETNLELTLSHSETRELTCSDHVNGRPDPSIFEWKINGTTVHTSDTFSLAADRDADLAKVQRAVLTCTATVGIIRTITVQWDITWSEQDALPAPPTGLTMTFDIDIIQENSEFRIFCRSSKSTVAYQYQILKKNQQPLDINGRGDLYTNTGIYTTGRDDREGFTIRCYDKLYGLERGNNQTMIVREVFPVYIEAVGETNLELTLSHSETRELTCSDHVTGRPDPSIFEWKINGTTVNTSDTFSLAADRDADLAKVQRAVLTCTASVGIIRTVTVQWDITWKATATAAELEAVGETNKELELHHDEVYLLRCSDHVIGNPAASIFEWKGFSDDVIQTDELKVSLDREPESDISTTYTCNASNAAGSWVSIQWRINWVKSGIERRLIGNIRYLGESTDSKKDLVEVECRASGFSNLIELVATYLDTVVGCRYTGGSGWVTMQEEEVVIRPGITIEAPTKDFCSTMNHTKASVLKVKADISSLTSSSSLACSARDNSSTARVELVQGWFPQNDNANSINIIDEDDLIGKAKNLSELYLQSAASAVMSCHLLFATTSLSYILW